MRFQQPAYTPVLLINLAETTPVSKTVHYREDSAFPPGSSNGFGRVTLAFGYAGFDGRKRSRRRR
jgi:hypothetical protein